ncbi:MAG: hypothetical protein JSW07_22870, partial [bacterium]
VNCDETWDLGRGASRRLVDSLGIAEVYAGHLNRIYAELNKLGKRMMMWGDIALKYPEILHKLPKETVMIAWNYSALDSFDHLIKPFKGAGFKLMISPGVLNSRRIMPDYDMTMKNIKNFVESAANDDVLGVLTTIWDDGGSAFFSRDWFGVAYAGEKSWNVKPNNNQDFDKRFNWVVYGDRQHSVSRAIWQLTELTKLPMTQEMNEKIFWSRVIPEQGQKLRINFDGWVQVSSICDAADQALDMTKPTQYVHDLDYLRFTAAQYRHLALIRTSMLEATELYRNACLRQMESPSEARKAVILALDKIGETYQSLSRLKDWFRTLWLQENRVYWLDKILTKYDARLRDLADTQTLILSALNDLDKGHYLPPPNEVRLAVEKSAGQYFQSWLICGPFSNQTGEGIKTDYLTSMGGELSARPMVASEVELHDGQRIPWRKFTSPLMGEVDLHSVFEQNEKVVAYAYCRVESSTDRVIRATLGSNDGIKVICNGQIIYEHQVKRNLSLDEDEIKLPFIEGKNHLLLKIDQNRGGWGFSFRLPDQVVRNHDYKYRIID